MRAGSSNICFSSFVQRSNRFEVGTIGERSDAFLLFSPLFLSFETLFLFPYSHHLFYRVSAFSTDIYIYIYAPFDNSLADDTTRQVPRSATDQYAFTIAAWNDNYCYTRDNSRRCPSVGIRVYCARRRKETCRGREREREEEEANYRVVYNTVHCILLTSTY